MRIFLFLLACTSLFCLDDEIETRENYQPKLNITNHTIQLPSGPLAYTATAGMCPIFGETTKAAELFFIYYAKDNEEDRPITFVFPGGPGGAGTWEALLSFGPRRLLSATEGRTIYPPYKIIDNPETLLEYTDLVFVDPALCGFSTLTENANPSYFLSVDGDIQILGTFIYNFINTAKRWSSPIYLSGGSYGTVRASGLALNLLQYDIAVRGIALNGCALDYSLQQSQRDQPLPDCLLIPTFAATAWYHKRLWPEKSLEEVVDYARRFAYDEYAPVMLQPSRLSHVEKIHFEQKFAELIGLPLDRVQRYNGRINEKIYTTEFFGSERKTLGGLDTRYSGDAYSIDPSQSSDPSCRDAIGIVPAFKSYLQKELNTDFPLKQYVLFSPDAFLYWNFNTYDSKGEISFLQRLRRALVVNPHMKVFVGSGYYDCRTPFASTEYCFEHLELPASYTPNLTFKYYEGGHGYLFDSTCLKKWKEDLVQFYTTLR
jgi:carboxypeptidase C (cathepsin A)